MDIVLGLDGIMVSTIERKTRDLSNLSYIQILLLQVEASKDEGEVCLPTFFHDKSIFDFGASICLKSKDKK